MKVIKENNDFGIKIFLMEKDKYLAFTFGGNLDLYWSIHINKKNIDENNNCDCFIITKENYGVYRLFEKLFFDIENINIFDKEMSEIEKNKYKLYNYSNYDELFDKNNKVITWYSDETAHKVSNILKIKKEPNTFKIEFYVQPYIEGYDRDFHSLGYIPIRFRNSGSSYDPFNIVFMKMYDSMKKIDDVNSIGHQIHMEEYLYNKAKAKKLIK